MQYCVAYIVGNTDPDGRAGCAQAFADIYRYVGTLAAAPALKVIVDILLSLCADPHPTVHFWALRSLATIVDTAGLDFSRFVNVTIVMLVKIYSLDSHEPEGGGSSVAATKSSLPVYEAFCQVIVALSGICGPENTESTSIHGILLALIRQLISEAGTVVIVAASRSLQQLLIVAPHAVPLQILVPLLSQQLGSNALPLRSVAINSVYQLVQREVKVVSRLGGNKFVDDLFGILDDDPLIDGVRQTIDSWMDQTAVFNPSAWVDICYRVMRKGKQIRATIKANLKTRAVGDPLEDEEAVALDISDPELRHQIPARWSTQLYALQCLRRLIKLVREKGLRQHLQPGITMASSISSNGLLFSRLSDLVKIASMASTAETMEIRLEGLYLLRVIMEVRLEIFTPYNR